MTAFRSRPVGRRRVLKAAGATAAAGVVGMPAIVTGQSGTIKIGVPTIQSGRVALVGQTSVGGMRSVFDPLNEAGGISRCERRALGSIDPAEPVHSSVNRSQIRIMVETSSPRSQATNGRKA